MIEIIYDTNILEGTCYLEVLPGKYKGEFWNTSSIFFTEESFGYILPAIKKCYKEFDYLAFNEIEIDTWKLIIKELDKTKQHFINNPNPHSLKDVLGFPFTYSEEEFMQDYDTNTKQLISMINEFQSWLEEKSASTKFISVLGL